MIKVIFKSQHLCKVFLLIFVLGSNSGCNLDSSKKDVQLFTDSEIEHRQKYIELIKETREILAPNGIQEQYELNIGGTQQWINVRGRDKENPVLLVIHGGPGWPQLPLAWNYQSPWEDVFTVVNWEQRGAGKNAITSNHEKLEMTMTLERLIQDAEELTIHLSKKFSRKKNWEVYHKV